MIRSVAVQTIAVLAAVVVVSLLSGFGRMAPSILIGGVVALLNFIFLSRSISGLLTPETAVAPLALIFNMVRLVLVMAALFILIYLKYAEIIGLSIGVTVTFLVVIKAGYFAAMKKP
ncbi:MAG: ATP synthase subunit I [Candidatus Magnetominusculus sp. LBB02]|nr:ATP synthase subunit I [Candidatus Magnetominusculus sp. LBB02]